MSGIGKLPSSTTRGIIKIASWFTLPSASVNQIWGSGPYASLPVVGDVTDRLAGGLLAEGRVLGGAEHLVPDRMVIPLSVPVVLCGPGPGWAGGGASSALLVRVVEPGARQFIGPWGGCGGLVDREATVTGPGYGAVQEGPAAGGVWVRRS